MYLIKAPLLAKLTNLGHKYFTAVRLFTGTGVSGTVWSGGHLAPVHTQWAYDRFGTGLGITTMQGREAKHVQIERFAKNSLYKQRWPQVFRHDYISKIWLPLKQPSRLPNHQAQERLIP